MPYRIQAGDISLKVINKMPRALRPFSKVTRKARLKTLLSGVGRVENALPLSSADTVSLIQQHLHCKRTSRLPALIVAATFKAAKIRRAGNEEQAGAVGDIQITIPGGHKMVTRCEMKNKAVQRSDIDRALQKIAAQGRHVQNYIFITTELVADDIREYARFKYDETGGIEIAILDCVGFLRHFLHLFHRLRKDFLDQYQTLVLHEPESAVSQGLKEAFLALRQAAESAD
jgi:hypothetical protein